MTIDNTKAKARFQQITSEKFQVEKGVKQNHEFEAVISLNYLGMNIGLTGKEQIEKRIVKAEIGIS